jgi:hypothetical protein
VYYFELARIGTGIGTAPYGIATGAAQVAAEQSAERDLQDRLATESELVPCPKCHWINDELVKGYRRSQYRGFTVPTIVVTILGTASALLCVWPISLGPPNDRWLLPYLIVGGPALSVSFAVAMFTLRAWLRSRIRPNKNFPLAPTLPAGTPPALLLDKTNDDLRPADPDQAVPTIADDWQEFQLGRHAFPMVCCNCLKPTTTEHAWSVAVTREIRLEIPRCAACADGPQDLGKRGWLILAAVVALVAGMAFTFWRIDSEYTCATNGAILILFFATVALLMYTAPGPSGPVQAEVVDSARGVVRLRFRNRTFAQMVAMQAKAMDERQMPRNEPPATAIKDG